MHSLTVPSFWETLLKGYVKKVFYADTRKKDFADRWRFTEGDYRFFARGVEKLSVAFTQERHSLPKNYLNQKEYRSGYLLYFLPVNALKVTALLSQNSAQNLAQNSAQKLLTSEGGTLRILDLGSGPGTGILGTMYHLETLLAGCKEGGKLKLQWVLIDQNREALNDAAQLYPKALEHLRQASPAWTLESELKTVTGNLFTDRLSNLLPPQEFDLVLALNFLSELPREKWVPLVETTLRGYLKPSGRLLIVEPALQRTTRDLMALHDELIERESGFVYAPCLHQALCPMLRANNRDWCHAYIPWERPGWIEKLDELVGIRKDYPKCSYLLLGKEPAPETPQNVWRVVSGALNSKGKSERLLCGPGGLPDLLRLTRLDRDVSAENQVFDQAQRGDRIELPKMQRVERKTKIRKIS